MNPKQLINQRATWYKSLNPIYCPAVKSTVVFNAKGFYHLKYNGLGHKRLQKEYIHRLYLLPWATSIITNATKIDKTRKRYEKSLGKIVAYWSLREFVGKNKIPLTIVLRKIGDGQITFYSIINK